jgi:branched-chain amino acid aminotransferase
VPEVWLNGVFTDESSASVSVRDTGLLHAAGVFTTMRAYNGQVFQLARHLARLRSSCDALFIPLQYRDEVLTAVVGEILSRNQLSEARLRLTVTRGVSTQDPLHGLRLEPTVFLTAAGLEPYPREFYERGMTVAVLDEQKLNPYDLQAGHKTLNYFSRLASLREANKHGAGEALWFNVHNYLQSGSISNVFIVKNNTLITPPTPQEMQDAELRERMPYPKSAVLPGVARSVILELAQEHNIATRLDGININQLLEADEVFLSNSIMQVMPVARVERHAIGADRPGPLTMQLAESYEALIAHDSSSE